MQPKGGCMHQKWLLKLHRKCSATSIDHQLILVVLDHLGHTRTHTRFVSSEQDTSVTDGHLCIATNTAVLLCSCFSFLCSSGLSAFSWWCVMHDRIMAASGPMAFLACPPHNCTLEREVRCGVVGWLSICRCRGRQAGGHSHSLTLDQAGRQAGRRLVPTRIY
jgi:hypothetical protein